MNEPRVSRFRQALAAAGLDGAVVRKPANVFYLSDYPAGLEPPSFLVVGRERLALVAPGSAEAARRVVGSGVEVVGYAVPGSTLDRVPDVPRLSAAAIESAVESGGLRGKRVGVEEAALSAWHAHGIARLATTSDLGDALEALRRIKDEGELAQIRAAVRVNDRGFEAAARAIAPGVSELAILNAVVAAMQEAAGLPIDVLDPTNAFISGPRTMLAAAPATPRPLETGDVMIVDVNPYVGAYKGDTTRSFCLGRPTSAQQRAHDSLVRGLEAAERIGRPGARGRDVFAALLGPVDAAGFGAGFRFHGGHALGLEHVERPYVIPGEEMVLEEGMVLALEPAVYLAEIGGLRIEDNYLVTSHGLAGLSQYPRELMVCD